MDSGRPSSAFSFYFKKEKKEEEKKKEKKHLFFCVINSLCECNQDLIRKSEASVMFHNGTGLKCRG